MAAADYRLLTEATGQRIATALESLVNLGDPVTISHGGTGETTAAAALAALGGVAVTDIVNNLTSTSTTAPLSANMGKVLNTTKEGTITPASSDINVANVIVRQYGNVVTMSGYAYNVPVSSNAVIFTISGVSNPSYAIRGVCGVAAHAYDHPEDVAYITLGTNGVLSINSTLSGNKFVYFSLSYIV